MRQLVCTRPTQRLKRFLLGPGPSRLAYFILILASICQMLNLMYQTKLTKEAIHAYNMCRQDHPPLTAWIFR